MQLLAGLGVTEQAAFKPTWHVDDKGMVILEVLGNPFSTANPLHVGSYRFTVLGTGRRIAKEIRASVGKEVHYKQYWVPNGQFTSNRKKKYSEVIGEMLFQLDPPAAPKDEKTSTLAAEGTVVQGVNANTSPDVQALIGALLGKKSPGVRIPTGASPGGPSGLPGFFCWRRASTRLPCEGDRAAALACCWR